jgi:hypothetical protein
MYVTLRLGVGILRHWQAVEIAASPKSERAKGVVLDDKAEELADAVKPVDRKVFVAVG